MSATTNSRCPECGYTHRTTADRLACDARHGRIRWPRGEIVNPYVICALCGCGAEFDLMLEHMSQVESHREVTTGCLIRSVVDAPGL